MGERRENLGKEEGSFFPVLWCPLLLLMRENGEEGARTSTSVPSAQEVSGELVGKG